MKFVDRFSHSAVFSDISDYGQAVPILRSASPVGGQLYPDLMEALLDIAENREIIAAEIAENTK